MIFDYPGYSYKAEQKGMVGSEGFLEKGSPSSSSPDNYLAGDWSDPKGSDPKGEQGGHRFLKYEA